MLLADIPVIIPPIEIITSEVYLLVIKDSEGTYHYFDKGGEYDGYSKDLICPIEDNPN